MFFELKGKTTWIHKVKVSKSRIYCLLNSPKKWTNLTILSIFFIQEFCSFLGELRTPWFAFEIVWPLASRLRFWFRGRGANINRLPISVSLSVLFSDTTMHTLKLKKLIIKSAKICTEKCLGAVIFKLWMFIYVLLFG